MRSIYWGAIAFCIMSLTALTSTALDATGNTANVTISKESTSKIVNFLEFSTGASYKVYATASGGKFVSAASTKGTVKPVNQSSLFTGAVAEKAIGNEPESFSFIFYGKFRPDSTGSRGDGTGSNSDLDWSINVRGLFLYIDPSVGRIDSQDSNGLIRFYAKENGDEESDVLCNWDVGGVIISNKTSVSVDVNWSDGKQNGDVRITGPGEYIVRATKVGTSSSATAKILANYGAGTSPTGDMQRMGGDWSFDNLPAGAAYTCKYGGRQFIIAKDLSDIDKDLSNNSDVKDTFNKDDAVLWRCSADDAEAYYTGTVFPAFGMNTTWLGANPIFYGTDPLPATCGFIMDIKDDGKYYKDSNGSDPHANSGSEQPFVDPSKNLAAAKYFQVKSVIIAYVPQDPIIETTAVKDGNRVGSSFVEVVGDKSHDIIFEVKAKAGTQWASGYPKFIYNQNELSVSSDSLGTTKTATIRVSTFSCNSIKALMELKNEYTVSVKTSPSATPITLQAFVYPSGSIDFGVGGSFQRGINSITVGTVSLSSCYSDDSPLYKNQKDVKEGEISIAMSWEEKTDNQVLLACKGSASMTLIEVNEKSLYLPAGVPGFNFEFSARGDVKVEGTIERNKEKPSGSGDISLVATITGSAGVSYGVPFVLVASAGLETSMKGKMGVCCQSSGLALRGTVIWDGLHGFATIKAGNERLLEGTIRICDEKTLIDESTMLCSFK